MSRRFSYIRYNEESQRKQQEIKCIFEVLEDTIESNLHDCRAKSLCMTALEEAYMWTGKAIRDQQILEDGFPGEQMERSIE